MSYFVLFDDNYCLDFSRDGDGDANRCKTAEQKQKDLRKNRLFIHPISVFFVYELDEAQSFFDKIDEWSKDHYVSLAFSYEFGYAFEPVLQEQYAGFLSNFPRHFSLRRTKKGQPLAVAAVFEKEHRLDDVEVDLFLDALQGNLDENVDPHMRSSFSLSRCEYFQKISEIKKILVEGTSYQVNFTLQKYFQFQKPIHLAWLYKKLRKMQPVQYGAFFNLPQMTLLSRSPGLFLRKNTEKLTTCPMKGTLQKEMNVKEADKEISNAEKKINEKLVAENLIVVDLLRNDLSKVAEKNSVVVEKFLDVENFRTLDQITSTISCRVRREIKFLDIFKALFPCGSVTGSPKVKTMAYIQSLEQCDRGFYCGALGLLEPRKNKASNDFLFNVGIRTLNAFEEEDNPLLGLDCRQFSLGLGSTVLMDSRADEEYKEVLLKSLFVDQIFAKKKIVDLPKDYYLFETMLSLCKKDWQIKNLSLHLDRLEKSAKKLDFPFIREELEKKIAAEISTLLQNKSPLKENNLPDKKVKLMLHKDGNIFLSIVDIVPFSFTKDHPPKVCFSHVKLDSNDPLLFHKTSYRKIYESNAFFYGKLFGFFDVLFFNDRQELCESTRHNVFLEKNKKWYTPPISSGLLPGIMRENILKEKNAEEKILYLQDVQSTDRIFLTNSITGCLEVKLEEQEPKNADKT